MQNYRKTRLNGLAIFTSIVLSYSGELLAMPTGPLNLKAAVDFALDNSPVYSSAKKTRSIDDLRKRTAVAKLLPSLDLTTTDGLQNNIPISTANSSTAIFTTNPTAPWYSSLGLGLTENLYDNGVTLTNIDIANLNRNLAEEQLRQTRDSITLDVVSEFYKYSLASVLLDVRKQQQELLNKQFRILSSQYQQGFKPKSDFLRLKIQVQQAEIDRISAENDLNQSLVNLRKLLSIGSEAKDLPNFIPVAVRRGQKIIDKFPNQPPPLDNFYDYRIAKIQQQINDKSVDLVVRNYWPQVLLSAGASYSNQNYINAVTAYSDGNQLSWNALATLNYNLWDWGSRKRDIAVAELNRDIQKNALDQNLIAVNANVQALMANIVRTDRSYDLNQELLTLQEQSNRDLEEQYRDGKVTYLDLITGLNSLLATRIQFYSAYFDALSSLSQFKFYEGKIYDAISEE